MQLSDVLLVPSRTDDRQLAVPELAAGQRPRPQQPVAVLVRPQRRHEQHERLRDAVGRDPGAGRSGIARPEQVVVDRLVDQPELARIDVQVLLDLGAQALGVDDDRVRDPRGARIVHPAVSTRQRARWHRAR